MNLGAARDSREPQHGMIVASAMAPNPMSGAAAAHPHPAAAWSGPTSGSAIMAMAVRHTPAKRKRATATVVDPRPDPFSLLELLTNEFDGLMVLHHAALAGFNVPLLDVASVAKEQQPATLHVDFNSRARGCFGKLAADSDSDGLSSDDERATARARAFSKPKQKRKRPARTTQTPARQSTTTHDEGKATVSLASTAAAAVAPPQTQPAIPADSSAARRSGDNDWISSNKTEPSSSCGVDPTASAAQADATRSLAPFVHVSSDSIRFRKAALPHIDLSELKKQRAQRLQDPREQDVKADEPNATTIRSNSDAAATATAPPCEIGATVTVNREDDRRSKRTSQRIWLRPATLPATRNTQRHSQASSEKENAAAAALARKAAIQVATAGMTARRARYIHTELTSTNVIPEGRRRQSGTRLSEESNKKDRTSK